MSKTRTPARHAYGRFGAGSPGRRTGTRNRVSHQHAMAMLDDFGLHKEDALNRMRNYHAPAYFKGLNRLLDRELRNEVPTIVDHDDIGG